MILSTNLCELFFDEQILSYFAMYSASRFCKASLSDLVIRYSSMSVQMATLYPNTICRITGIFLPNKFNVGEHQRGCSSENLRHIFRTLFPKNASRGLLL